MDQPVLFVVITCSIVVAGQLTHWLNPPECKEHSPQGHRRLRQRTASVRSPLKALGKASGMAMAS